MIKYESGLDRIFHALADPTRRTIVGQLANGPASVSELAAPLPMSLAAVMQHLKVLEGSGLLHTEKLGRVRTCMIDPDVLACAEAWLGRCRVCRQSMPSQPTSVAEQPAVKKSKKTRKAGKGKKRKS